jgi:hypothetical protein
MHFGWDYLAKTAEEEPKWAGSPGEWAEYRRSGGSLPLPQFAGLVGVLTRCVHTNRSVGFSDYGTTNLLGHMILRDNAPDRERRMIVDICMAKVPTLSFDDDERQELNELLFGFRAFAAANPGFAEGREVLVDEENPLGKVGMA